MSPRRPLLHANVGNGCYRSFLERNPQFAAKFPIRLGRKNYRARLLDRIHGVALVTHVLRILHIFTVIEWNLASARDEKRGTELEFGS
jgi:hypothetical protein